ncbi:transposase [Ahrensia kielensis]|uniref:transposase n=1 Tax=Ahrensia kielensis TaxID=76980 RepID=UPI003CCC7AA3
MTVVRCYRQDKFSWPLFLLKGEYFLLRKIDFCSNLIKQLHKKVVNLNETAANNLFIQTRWPEGVTCPYCNSKKISNFSRYFCNTCKTSFSLTTGSILHNTKLPILLWLKYIDGAFEGYELSDTSSLQVNKNTLTRMKRSVTRALHKRENREFLLKLLYEFRKEKKHD